jgi:hypothetical protein
MPSSTSGAEQSLAARHLARAILSEGRFHEPTVPRPLHTALREIGRLLESPLNGINELVNKIAASTPGGAPLVWVLLALVLAGVAAALALTGVRRASKAPLSRRWELVGPTPPSAAELEREADGAERAGRYEEAVRLRFRAGVLSLSERELLEDAPSMVNHRLISELHSPAFEQLAGRFDEIAYGASRADEQDAQRARDGWARVLEEAGRK